MGTDLLRASGRTVDGLIAAASGQPERARGALEDAISLFARAGVTYEASRARVELARSLIALDRDDAARAELERACRAFEGLGATGDVRGTRALLADACGRPAVAPGRRAAARPGAPESRDREAAHGERIHREAARRQYPHQAGSADAGCRRGPRHARGVGLAGSGVLRPAEGWRGRHLRQGRCLVRDVRWGRRRLHGAEHALARVEPEHLGDRAIRFPSIPDLANTRRHTSRCRRTAWFSRSAGGARADLSPGR